VIEASSLEATQDKLTCVLETAVAVSVPGAVGGDARASRLTAAPSATSTQSETLTPHPDANEQFLPKDQRRNVILMSSGR
jgi:hypothetical protein